MADHSSILAWKSPWTEESGGLKSMGLHDGACMQEGGVKWVGSNKVVELKKKKKIILRQKATRKQNKVAVFNSGSGQRKGRSDDALDGRQQWVREGSSLRKGK